MAEKYRITQSRVLYVYGFPNPDRGHRKFKGLLKIGEVFVDNEDARQDEQALKALVRGVLSGRKYITEHDGYEIIFVQCTTYNNSTACYKAQAIHDCLKNSGIESVYLSGRGKTEDIWFKATLTDVEKAIEAVKSGKKSFNGTKVGQKKIDFRPEQKAAIDATVKRFKTKTGNRFLWNAKMRFGKTLSALQVVKEMEYERTLILTHRPVVDDGFYEDFQKIFFEDPSYHYGSKTKGERFEKLERLHTTRGDSYVYFASMQDLRGSKLVGGKYNKNHEIFKIAWDCVIVDEAHEGTLTGLGKSVIAALEKEHTRVLRLSGTPFNLLDSFNQDEIYTWDYVMEQKAKLQWDDEHYGDPNPYADLPKMRICTFTTNKLVKEDVGEGKYFSFHEFFRTWKGDEKLDGKKMSKEDCVGDFVRKEPVKEFVKRLRTPSDDNKFPFSTLEFQQSFRHTFWIVPGVAEAAALEKVLKEDDVFGSKTIDGKPWFTIVNVAGDGNIEDKNGEALTAVKNAIVEAGCEGRYTITISCGKLTTGVSIPEWTAVLCMKGSEHTPPANYMQTIFRVQTHAVLEGKQKANCYVFDFAPDRALVAVAETSKVQATVSKDKSNKIVKLSDKKEKEQLANFIELCPIISMDGGKMDDGHFTADKLFEKLKDVYIEKAVRSGYADNSLYDSKMLLNLTPQQEAALDQASKIVGKMKAAWKPDPITVNSQGFTGIEDAEDAQVVYHLQEERFPIPAKPVASGKAYVNGAPIPQGEEWSAEKPSVDATYKILYSSHCLKKNGKWGDYGDPVVWQEYKEYKDKSSKTAEQQKREEENKEKRARMSVLRGVSIRIPLLVYGADINDDEEAITIDNFAGCKADGTPLVDDLSWEEFMPKGFTKKMFNDLKDCFDPDIFTGAGKRIREMVKEADKFDVEERINYIAKIFGYMHNPDKETVLTPWRVVNMQLSDCLGGYTFYDEDFDEFYSEDDNPNERVRFVDKGKVTEDVFGDYDSSILEINSKTGLYPLYMAYSLYKKVKKPEFAKHQLLKEKKDCTDSNELAKVVDDDQVVWDDIIQNNLFVICNTAMAVKITKRTLCGFREVENIHIKNIPLIANAKSDKKGLVRLLSSEGFWYGNNKESNMKFNVIVGNPPYQENDGSGAADDAANPVYHEFMRIAKDIKPHYISLIMPSKWMVGGKSVLKKFRSEMVEDVHLAQIFDYENDKEIFPNAHNDGGICYLLWDSFYDEGGNLTYRFKDIKGVVTETVKSLQSDMSNIVVRDEQRYPIIEKVKGKGSMLSDIISNTKPFGIRKDLFNKPERYPNSGFSFDSFEGGLRIHGVKGIKGGAKRTIGYVKSSTVTKNSDWVNQYKLFFTTSYSTNAYVPPEDILSSPGSICTETFIVIGPFGTEEEMTNCHKYLHTNFVRSLLYFGHGTMQVTAKVFEFVPCQDFTSQSDIDWSLSLSEIDEKLYEKYGFNDAEIRYLASLATK